MTAASREDFVQDTSEVPSPGRLVRYGSNPGARDHGEVASISHMIQHLIQSQGADSRRIYATGRSAGGAIANAILATYPDTFFFGATVGGLPFGVASNVGEAFERMQGCNRPKAAKLQSVLKAASSNEKARPAISVWHGTHDQTVKTRDAEQIVEQWSGVHGLSSGADRSADIGKISRRAWLSAKGAEVPRSISSKGWATAFPWRQDSMLPSEHPCLTCWKPESRQLRVSPAPGPRQ